jgi:hypothetical protein
MNSATHSWPRKYFAQANEAAKDSRLVSALKGAGVAVWLRPFLLAVIAALAIAQSVPDNVVFEKQVAYNAVSRLSMDIARPNEARSYPAVFPVQATTRDIRPHFCVWRSAP